MKKNWAEELAGVLSDEKDVLSRLSDLSQQKKAMILGNDTEGIRELLNREQPLVMQLEYMEHQRLLLMKNARMQGKTLREVAESGEADNSGELLKLLASFSGIVSRIKTANGLNEKLIRSRLELCRALRGAGGQAYGPAGAEPADAGAPGLIDRKA